MDFGIPFSVILLGISIIVLLIPPTKINRVYGYRTSRSMKNIENWKFSNRFFPIGFIIINAFNFIVLYLASLIFEIDSLSIYFYIVPLLIEIAVLIYITENKMKNENL